MSNAAETPAGTARCLRCGRRLKSARSVAASYGPGCRARIRREAREHALDGLNDRQRDKALEVVSDGGVVRSGHKGVWLVASGDGSQVYRATVNGNCSCAWGVRRTSAMTKPCAHVGAVRLVQVPCRRSLAKAA